MVILVHTTFFLSSTLKWITHVIGSNIKKKNKSPRAPNSERKIQHFINAPWHSINIMHITWYITVSLCLLLITTISNYLSLQSLPPTDAVPNINSLPGPLFLLLQIYDIYCIAMYCVKSCSILHLWLFPIPPIFLISYSDNILTSYPLFHFCSPLIYYSVRPFMFKS